MEMKCHEILEQKMCKEIEMIEAKYAQNPNMELSIQDLDKLDKLYHALKSQATWMAMKEAEEYESDGYSGEDGYSGRRGRSMTTGRYVSRNMGPRMSGYPGYDDGYSGHYPPQPYPYRW